MKMVALRCGGFNNVDVERFGGEWLERGVEGRRLQRRRPTSWASPSPGRWGARRSLRRAPAWGAHLSEVAWTWLWLSRFLSPCLGSLRTRPSAPVSMPWPWPRR